MIAFRTVSVLVLIAGVSAFSPVFNNERTASSTSSSSSSSFTALYNSGGGPTLGAGGMADTRDPNELQHEDPRKSISAAPSFEEYLKMREGGTATNDSAAAAPANPAPAAPPAPAPAASSRSSSTGGSGDAISDMETSQAATIDKIASSISDLASKPDFTWTTSDNELVEGCVTTIDARDAAGPANVAWLAGVCVESKMSSLTVFNGPLTDVPHLVSRCTVLDNNNNKLHFKLDFRPRCYGAYEMKRDDGSYPGPEEFGRKSFEYSGARKEFETKFGNDQVQEFIQSTLASFDGAETYDPEPINELDLLTRGPLFTSVIMPNTDANVAAVVAAREKAADFWLAWALDNQHEHRPGAPVNTQYVYDTKFKQNAYGALLAEYQTVFGAEDGKKVAVGESGPLDEAYVGGAS